MLNSTPILPQSIIGIGAGGHAKSILDIIKERGDLVVMGLLDSDPNKIGDLVCGVPILGGDGLLEEIFLKGVSSAFVGVGGVGSNRLRQKLFDKASQIGFEIYSPIHPSAVVSSYVTLGRGVHIMALARVNVDAKIGDNVVINTGTIVEHDCQIGDHVHLATGATLSGGVRIGKGAHVGTGASIRQGITIGEGAIVGAGAVVVKDVTPYTTVVGVPARPIE